MQRIRIVGLALMAVFALSAVAASAASAVEGPFWKVNGSRLLSGETRLLLATAKENFILEDTVLGQTITCTALTLPEAAQMEIIGSTGGNAGKSKEVIDFTGCTQVGNGVKCTVVNSLVNTVPVLNLLGYSTAAKGGPALVLFEPESGKVFATVKYTSTVAEGCKSESQGVTGTTIALAQVGGAQVAVGGGTETLHGEVRFHKLAKAIFIEKEGVVGAEVKSKLELAGTASTLQGTALLLVDSAGSPVPWGVFS